VLEILRVITEVGYSGYVSFELFSWTMNEVGEQVPREHARRGEISWGKLVKYMDWDDEKVVAVEKKRSEVVIDEVHLVNWAGGAEVDDTR
jgi:hypothetical protein